MKRPTRAVDCSRYGPEVIAMMDNTDRCLNCGRKLKWTDKSKRRNRGYCSLACYYAKPPKLAYLEQEYGKSAREVIVELLNRHQKIAVVAELCGWTRWHFFRVLEKLQIKRKVVWV